MLRSYEKHAPLMLVVLSSIFRLPLAAVGGKLATAKHAQQARMSDSDIEAILIGTAAVEEGVAAQDVSAV
jgi:hypothetical protein